MSSAISRNVSTSEAEFPGVAEGVRASTSTRRRKFAGVNRSRRPNKFASIAPTARARRCPRARPRGTQWCPGDPRN